MTRPHEPLASFHLTFGWCIVSGLVVRLVRGFVLGVLGLSYVLDIGDVTAVIIDLVR